MSELREKVDTSIRLLRTVGKTVKGPIELSYSGGKDSDVILALAKMAGIEYRAIYKNTTIDPRGTIKHVKDNGVEVVRPVMTFFELISKKGFPTRRARFCCSVLKEYKILDTAIQGIRRCESTKRAKLYKEPIICRIYGSKNNHVNVVLPILDWTDRDVAEFIEAHKIQCHPLYYDESGRFHVSRRLGCVGCPLQGDKGLADFKNNPRMVKAWLKAGQCWWSRPHRGLTQSRFLDVYELFTHNIFFDSFEDFRLSQKGMFGDVDCKKFLEDFFNIEL